MFVYAMVGWIGVSPHHLLLDQVHIYARNEKAVLEMKDIFKLCLNSGKRRTSFSSGVLSEKIESQLCREPWVNNAACGIEKGSGSDGK